MSFLLDKKAPVYVAGHRGMVGSAILRKLVTLGFTNLLTKTHSEMDLTSQSQVQNFFAHHKPRYVFLAAAKVGGIKANNDAKCDFLYENLAIQNNVIKSAADSGVEKLLFLGSSCIYPKLAPQPIKEEYLLTGALEPTNEGYALAKIAGLKLCEYYFKDKGKKFISGMPTNLYGVGDNFHPDHSHVIPGLLVKFHQAKMQGRNYVELWGTGKPYREFLFVDDCADALISLMEKYEAPETVNVGCGQDITIAELAQVIQKVVGFQGDIRFNPAFPDGTPRKLLDVSRIFSLGWRPHVSLNDGIIATYKWALENQRI